MINFKQGSEDWKELEKIVKEYKNIGDIYNNCDLISATNYSEDCNFLDMNYKTICATARNGKDGKPYLSMDAVEIWDEDKNTCDFVVVNMDDIINGDAFNIPEFDYKVFKKEIQVNDLAGLDYLEKTLIREYKDKINDNLDKLTYYDYIIDLFYATKSLNACNNIYETIDVGPYFKINFNFDDYAIIRNLLFKEIGFNLEDLYR